MAHTLDADTVTFRPGSKEYGPATLKLAVSDTLFRGLPTESQVWMSHGDSVRHIPSGFRVLGSTDSCPVAAMGDLKNKLFGVQFHPEVVHTKYGDEVLRNFVIGVCQCQPSWEPNSPLAVDRLLNAIRDKVGPRQRVLFFVSGGVDSSVAYRLCVEALGADRVHGIFVDTGFLRLGEVAEVEASFSESGFTNIDIILAAATFLHKIGDASVPEEKRRRIGAAFLDVENEVLRKFPRGEWLLGQGTIYPDTIESGGSKNAALIKTHHNRVPELLERIANGEILEPLAKFYKDEVRQIGVTLGLPDTLVHKEPFPGPGLAVRCLCLKDRLSLSHPDSVVLSQIGREFGFSATALPIRAVGVQGDERTYAAVAVLENLTGDRDWGRVGRASRAITNAVPNINRVAYLFRTKAPVKTWVGHAATLSRERLDRLREADAIARKAIESDPAFGDIWQCPVVQIPMGGRGTSREVIVLRPVHSVDGMTGEFVGLADSTLVNIADQVLEDPSVEALLCDVTNKPPATIEWE